MLLMLLLLLMLLMLLMLLLILMSNVEADDVDVAASLSGAAEDISSIFIEDVPDDSNSRED